MMPLIEKKDFGFAGVYPDKRCACGVNIGPVARNVSRHSRNETATLATSLYNRTDPGIENNKVPLHFCRDQKF
jgi:hypothetical protein